MKWQCPVCGLGPIEIRILPVYHACVGAQTKVEQEPSQYLACVHRGDVVGQHVCETCGSRGLVADVFRCELLEQPCVLRPWTTIKSKLAAAGEVACITCPLREAPA